jgi:hypothetical protein
VQADSQFRLQPDDLLNLAISARAVMQRGFH